MPSKAVRRSKSRRLWPENGKSKKRKKPGPKLYRGRVPTPHSGTTKANFIAVCPHNGGNSVPTYMGHYLIHLVNTEGLPITRVFRGLILVIIIGAPSQLTSPTTHRHLHPKRSRVANVNRMMKEQRRSGKWWRPSALKKRHTCFTKKNNYRYGVFFVPFDTRNIVTVSMPGTQSNSRAHLAVPGEAPGRPLPFVLKNMYFLTLFP